MMVCMLILAMFEYMLGTVPTISSVVLILMEILLGICLGGQSLYQVMATFWQLDHMVVFECFN